MDRTEKRLTELLNRQLKDVTEEALKKAIDENTEIMILQEKAKEGDRNAIEQLLFINGIEFGSDTHRGKRRNN
jgi:hypothetical protein